LREEGSLEEYSYRVTEGEPEDYEKGVGEVGKQCRRQMD
jgi:hypothetical protein